MKRLRDIFTSDSECGSVLTIAVLTAAIFIGVAGLAVDYGNAVMLETRMQQATDRAAMAGIQEVPDAVDAELQMLAYFDDNYPRSSEASLEAFTDSNSCWVTATHEVPTYFMKIFGRDSLTIKAQSKARIDRVDAMMGGKGIVPFVLVNPGKNSNPWDDLDASNHGKPYMLKYGSDNIMLNDWYMGRQQIAEGNIHADDASVPDGGWRSVVGLDPNSLDPADESLAAGDFEDNFAEGWKGHIKVGDILTSNPGVMTSGTTKGRDRRIEGDYTDWYTFDPDEDKNSSRIIIVPIISLGDYDDAGNWHQATDAEIADSTFTWKDSRVDGFAAFYLLDANEQAALPGGSDVGRKWVAGRYLHNVMVGGSFSDDDGGDLDSYFGMKQGRLVPFDS